MKDRSRERPARQPPPLNTNTRRRFLADIGRAGGAAVMYETMQAMGLFRSSAEARAQDGFTPLARTGKSAQVLVLGGGIAGLTSAYELLKGGYSVTILEARQRPGGRNWTARGGTQETELEGAPQTCQFARDHFMNCGPARLPQGHITIDYCRELGVELQVFTNVNADSYYFNENDETTDYGALASQPVRHRTAKADYFGYVSELLAKVTQQGALDAELSATDQELLLEFLRSFGELEAADDRYAGGPRRGYTTVPGAGDQPGVPLGPAPTVSQVLQSRLGLNFAFELEWDQAMLMFQPVGGMDRIPYAFARAIERLGGKIVYGAEVTQITNTEDGVEIAFTRDGTPSTAAADYSICAIPPHILARIPSNFSAEVKTALLEPVPFATGKVGLEYGRRFWETDERILGGITNTNLNIGTIWYPSYSFLVQRGVVVGSYNFGEDAEYFATLTPQQRIEEAIKQGSKIHGPAYRDELESAWAVSWRRIRYTEGGWVDWESREQGYSKLNEPEGNVFFAGDHLSYEIAWQAGAIYSGRKAVQALASRVGSTASLMRQQLSRFA